MLIFILNELRSIGTSKINTLRYAASFSSISFDNDIALEKVDDLNFQRKISSSFSIGDAPNGGYLAAIAVNAVQKSIKFQHPLTISSHFVSKVVENEIADVNVKLLNVGKSTANVLVSISQLKSLKYAVLCTFGTIKNDFSVGITSIQNTAPLLPNRNDCINVRSILDSKVGTVTNRIDMLVPRESEFLKSSFVDSTSTTAKYECWLRHREDRPLCINSMTFLQDCIPPPVLNIVTAKWIPTIEYTVHYWRSINEKSNIDVEPLVEHDTSNKYWVRARFSSAHVEGGRLHTDSEIWSADGSFLLAKSRQLARVYV